MQFRSESMDWQQRLKLLVVDDIKRGKITLKLLQGTTEFRTAVFDDNDDDAVRAALLGIIEPPAAAEGEPPSKKAKRSAEECQSSDEFDLKRFKVATSCYYEKLLEAPLELPKSTEELRSFLSTRREKLPLLEEQYSRMKLPNLVKRCTSEAEQPLKFFLYSAFLMMRGRLENEATSSSGLFVLTGQFIKHLNDHAPEDRQLRGLRFLLDAPNPEASEAASEALQPLFRPDFQLFVRNALMLRWENTIDVGDISKAIEIKSMEPSLLWYAPLCDWWLLRWKAVSMAEALTEWRGNCC